MVRDYLPSDDPRQAEDAVAELGSLETEQLLVPHVVASLLQAGRAEDLDAGLQPRGYRLLARLPRLSQATIDAIVARFGSLQKIMRSEIEELEAVEGVDAAGATTVKDGLSRLAESSILDRYS